MSSFTEGVEAERETIAEFLTCAWQMGEGVVIEHAMVKAPRVLELHLRKSSCARLGVWSSCLLWSSCAWVETVLLRSETKMAGMGNANVKLINSKDEQEGESIGMDIWQSGCVDGAGGGLSRRVETCKAIGMSLGGHCSGSEEEEILGQTSGLGEGVKGPFGESLSSPGGVSIVDKWWGEMGTLSKNLRGGGSGETMLLDDKDIGRAWNIEDNSRFAGGSADAILGTFPALRKSNKRVNVVEWEIGVIEDECIGSGSRWSSVCHIGEDRHSVGKIDKEDRGANMSLGSSTVTEDASKGEDKGVDTVGIVQC
ncbi:hypothetical protein EDB92DRAFT_1815432 [Lactarius akahatsu]|uniref:Uncharacterized protein n=1 Tax=Lactarius akahatsu TaxID=416441 RepID=A0AAD4LNQ5_9AGAM|nr:hypothetical protein EDB92DRAFT_1815432 [Lactarius akahatsu]